MLLSPNFSSQPPSQTKKVWTSTAWRSPERKRPWLLSEHTSEQWKLRTGRRRKPPSIRWDRKLPDGSTLIDPRHAVLLSTGKQYLEILTEDPLDLRNLDKTSSALNRTSTLLIILERLAHLGARSFAQVSPSEMDEIIEDAVFGVDCVAGRRPRSDYTNDKALTVEAIMAYYRVLRDIWDFSRERFSDGTPLLPMGLLFDPFAKTRSYRKLAEVHGKEVGRTTTLSHHTGLLYLDRSVQYVMDHSTELLDLRDRAEQISAQVEAEKQNAPKGRNSGEIPTALANFAINFLASAATRDPANDADATDPTRLAVFVGCDPSTLRKSKKYQPLLQALDKYVCYARQKTAADRVLVEACRLLETGKLALAKAQTDAVREQNERKVREAAVRKRVGLPYTGSSEAPGAPWPIKGIGHSQGDGSSLTAALNHLWSACYIVIAAFMADRIGEMTELQADCLKLTPVGPEIEHVITKPVGSEAGVTETKPCPAVVGEAVKVLSRLGEGGPGKSSERLLFAHYHRLGYGVPDDSAIRRRLAKFGVHIGIASEETEKATSLGTHELRRWFSIVFMWVYEYPDLNALRRHLGHADLEATARYATEARRGSISAAYEQRNFTNFIMTEILMGKIDGHGRFGEYLSKLGQRIDVEAMPPEHFEQFVERLRDKHGIVLRPSPWGYCAWNPARASQAACRMPDDPIDGSGPNEARRTPRNCGGCINFLNHNKFLFFWQSQYHRYKKDMGRKNIPPVWRDAAEEGFALATDVLGKFHPELGLRPIEEMVDA